MAFASFMTGCRTATSLVVRCDRREPLVVLPLSLAIQVAKAAERGRR